MWVVGLNRPYYPSVEFFNSEEEALKEYNGLLEENEEDGMYDVKVFMAKIENIYDIKTYY